MARNLAQMCAAILLGAFLGSIMVRIGPGLPISIAFSFVVILLLYNSLHDIEGEAELVKRLFLVGAVGRVLLALFLHNVIRDPATLAGDDAAYELFGRGIADSWRGEATFASMAADAHIGDRALQNAYTYWNASLFYVLGDDISLLPKCINAAFGALTPIFFYRIAWRLSDSTTARYALYITSLAPSMVLWSVLNLRDSFAILAITTSVYFTIRLKESFQPGDVIKLALSMLAVTALRTYMFVILGLALALSFIGLRRGHEFRDLFVGFLVAFVLFYIFSALGLAQSDALKDASFAQLNNMRTGLASGNSAYAVGVDVSSPTKALLFLPVGVTYFLFAPFPWELSSFRQLLAFPEVLLFYILFPYVVGGIRRVIKTDLARWLPVLFPALLVTVTYSIVEGNVGTAFRHKAQVLGLYFIFAAYELAARAPKRGEASVA